VATRFIFTKKAMRRIQSLRKRGYSLREIATVIGCSRTLLRERGFDLGSLRRRYTEQEAHRMVAMRKQGHTLQQIAIALGCSESSVRNHVRHLGPIPSLQTSPRSRPPIIPKATRMRVLRLRKRGYPFEKIANLLGMAYGTARAIVLTGGRPPAGRSRHNFRKTPEDVITRILALRREGSSHAYIADAVGVSTTTVGRILKSNGFPAKIKLQRLAGPVGRRVRGICRIKGCGVRHFGSGLCSTHQLQYRQGRIDKSGKVLPSTCIDCGAKFPRNPQRKRCERCRRAHLRKRAKWNRDCRLRYIDHQGRPLSLICQQCGKEFQRRLRKLPFCKSCAAARPNMLRRQRGLLAKREPKRAA